MKNLKISDIKKAVKSVQAVHACASCAGHLEAIKEHTKRGHKE